MGVWMNNVVLTGRSWLTDRVLAICNVPKGPVLREQGVVPAAYLAFCT